MSPYPDRRQERGMVLPSAAILMMLLLAVSAFAIDLGNLRRQRLDLQGVADLAALAGAQDLPDTRAATRSAMALVERNIGLPHSAWTGCNADDPLPRVEILLDAIGNTCISFSMDATRIRVVIPEQLIDTYFGGVLGISSFDMAPRADAATVVVRSRKILPATMTASVNPGMRCVEMSGSSTPCDGHEDGFFASILSPRRQFYIPSVGNLDGEAQAVNYAMNLDHEVVPYVAGDPGVCDGKLYSPPCVTTNATDTDLANHLIISTGNSVPPVTAGMVTGGSLQTTNGTVTFCGRLTRPDFTPANALDPRPDDCTNPGRPTITQFGLTLNGRHIYYWMTPETRALFYPEVMVPTGALPPPVGDPSYQAGDARLACFLEGYRYDTATGIETVPDCHSTGLILPSLPTGSVIGVLDSWVAGYGSYADPGMPAVATPWMEPAGDGDQSSGAFQIAPAALPPHLLVTAAAPINSFVYRSVSLPSGTTSARIRADIATDGPGPAYAVQSSIDGTSWTTIGSSASGVSVPIDVTVNTMGATDLWIRTGIIAPFVGTSPERLSNLRVDFLGPVVPTGQTIGPLFESEMLDDVRFAVIPIITDWPSSGTKAAPVQGFWYGYIYNLFGSSQKVHGFDSWVFDPALLGHDSRSAFTGYGFDLSPHIRLER
ncbi:MAG: pilus assembly protein TadG-related protein [Acidimicrobiales bacterium]